jgi:hypothetical protein
MRLVWTNPRAVDTCKGIGFLYFARIVDSTTGREHRYIGQSRRGESRLREYRFNVLKGIETTRKSVSSRSFGLLQAGSRSPQPCPDSRLSAVRHAMRGAPLARDDGNVHLDGKPVSNWRRGSRSAWREGLR